jgi:hypothetical protein
MSTARRAAVGFQGGQVLSLRIAEDHLNELRQSLAQGKVVYLRVESDEQRVGF